MILDIFFGLCEDMLMLIDICSLQTFDYASLFTILCAIFTHSHLQPSLDTVFLA